MHPTHLGQIGSSPAVRENRRRSIMTQDSQLSRSNSSRLRTEDSWIEISSQPSSSSLSSAGENDVITTGLHIEPRRIGNPPFHIRTRSHSIASNTGPLSAAGSSQDEYEESESESDRVLGSSNEDLAKAEDEDDNDTALGVREESIFTPQPNVFSHPPSSRNAAGPSYFPDMPTRSSRSSGQSNRTLTQRNHNQRSSLPQSFPNNRQPSFDTSNHPSSSQPDHDAALRASLTTLLSCAAAVRSSSSPKQRDTVISSTSRKQSHAEPRNLRLVPESQLLDEETPEPIPRKSSARTSPSNLATRSIPVTKRKARESSKERHIKKVRSTTSKTVSEDELIIHSTLMSWMISAGVVLVFSAISFSAGYAWGKDVGKLEAEIGLGACGNCGQEALRSGSGSGLRRLRWSTATSSVRA